MKLELESVDLNYNTSLMLEKSDDYELKEKLIDSIWKTLDTTIKFENLLLLFKEQKEKHKNFESILADVISVIDVEISSFTDPARKEKFLSIISQLRPIVGDDLLRERLEIDTLENLKLIQKKEAFNQKYVKIKTRLFYKQQKFNLLREESEGYSKLITELGQTNLNEKVLENIQSLIGKREPYIFNFVLAQIMINQYKKGCFNLDPNRVLDIILESFENNPIMFKTFIHLLRNYKVENDTICQMLGFKFQSIHQLQQQQMSTNKEKELHDHYSFHQLKNASSLYKVTSYLLKHQIIELDLLMPHLYPNEQEIQQTYKDEFESARQYAKKLTSINLSEAASDSSTQSSTSGDKLSSDDKTQSTTTTKSQIDNQKICLVSSLIEIGDYKTALRIIEKLPQWYLAIDVEICMSICHSINKNFVDNMYKKYNLLSKYLQDKSLSTNGYKFDDRQKEDNDDEFTKSQIDCTNILESYNELLMPILCAIGPGLAYDPILFTKIIRIYAAFLDLKKFTLISSACSATSAGANNGLENGNGMKESSPPPSLDAPIEMNHQEEKLTADQILKTLNDTELIFYNQIYLCLNDVLLPSLSMLSMNPCLAIELWNLLKLFPYEMRYNLYNYWRQFTYKLFPSLIRARAESQEKIKYLLKRLSKENVKIHGRQIGKLSHNNPIIVCDYILTQIQRYDNFIVPVVDSLKFMTPLSYDVLSFSIIIAISDPDKEKMKHDSTNISSWLQSIATFCALTFKKYPIELIAMIQLVINQLKNKKSFDLLILQEIVQKMCGIEVLSEVNDLQLEAMAGGDLLRQEAGYFNPIRNIKKCANRLKEALADHGLILPLCILLSQQRDYIVFGDQVEREQQRLNPISLEKRHLKLTGSLYDQCQDSLVQFSQFLSSTLTTEEYIHIFPKIDELVNEYHVSPDVAFFLCRPMYSHHIQSKYEEFRRVDRNIKTGEKPSKTQRYLESIDIVMQPVIDLARSLHPSKIWEDMSPLFYTTFWTLSMSDCFVPTSAYDKQKQSLKQKLNALDDNLELTSAKKKKEKEKIMIMMDKLIEEEQKQKDHVQHVRARFDKEKDFWFPQKSKTKNETITVFLQLCIFSRCLFTQIDAYYCSKFIQIIHSLKTPNFSTIICYDRIFSDISYSIASLTDNEARRYGRFLLGLLETVMAWHTDASVFEQECGNHPGFLTIFRNALSSTQTQSNKQEQLDYENYRHVCHKWHYKLTKSFIVCLESKEYLQMRNALIILTKISSHYPKLTSFCSALEKRVEKIKQVEKDKRQDIYTLASAYLGQLKMKKSQMLEESEFHQKEVTDLAATGSSSSTTSSSSMPTSKSKQLTTTTATSAAKTQAAPSTTTTSSSQFKHPLPKSSQSSSSNPASSSSSKQTGASSSGGSSSSSSSSHYHHQATSHSGSSSSSTSQFSSSSRSGSDSSKQSQSQSSSSVNGSGSSHSASHSSRVASSPQPSHSSASNKQDESQKDSRTSSSTNGSSSSVTSGSSSSSGSKSNKRPASPSVSSSTRNGNANEYSPTTSVSSDEWQTSPNRPGQANSLQDVHSRSTSPVNNKSSLANNNGYYSSSSGVKVTSSSSMNSISASESKYSKRSKVDAEASSTKSYESSKRKSSRDRSLSSTASDLQRQATSTSANSGTDYQRSDNKDKGGKEHRKREHSSEITSDVQHKRSKSDEAKKKQSASSSSSSVQSQSQQSSSSSSTKRGSSKKSDSSSYKDDYQSPHSPPQQQQQHSSFSKHRSSNHTNNDDRRNSSSSKSYQR